MNLEKSLVQYLKSRKKLKYKYDEAEPGFVGLCKFEEIKEDVIWIDGETGKSYYQIPAINLTNECDGYDPEFILLWLPNEKKYGTWDTDHWILYIFENTIWENIVKNPLPYINCQWDIDQTVGTNFDPSGKYELIKGWPF